MRHASECRRWVTAMWCLLTARVSVLTLHRLPNPHPAIAIIRACVCCVVESVCIRAPKIWGAVSTQDQLRGLPSHVGRLHQTKSFWQHKRAQVAAAVAVYSRKEYTITCRATPSSGYGVMANESSELIAKKTKYAISKVSYR